MNGMFYDIVDKYVLVYLDDILICSNNANMHN